MSLIAARSVWPAIRFSRAASCAGLTAVALLLGSQGLQNAAANGDTRTISLRHIHTGESASITYKREGRYDEAGLKQINHILRDWRRDEEIRMDPRVIDTIWEVNREVGGSGAIEIICGYRAPATNQMLRRRSRGVAQFSQHTLGKAVDFHIPGATLESVRIAGLRLQRGGVGFYPSSNFVHLDVGSIRHWPRMSHDQLARVFPDGRTVHVPSDGRPLSGYALALADVKKHGASPSQMSLAAAENTGVETADTASAKPKKNLLAALFGSKDEDEDNELAVAASAPPAPAVAPRVKTVAVPLPTARPSTIPVARETKPARSGTFAVAASESRPIDLSPPPAAEKPAADNVFTARGLWEGPQGRPEPPADIPDHEGVQVADAGGLPPLAPARMRVEPRPAELEVTSGVTPWPTQRGNDRVPADVALAYAAQNDGLIATATPRAAPMGDAVARAAGSPSSVDTEGLTTIIKKTIARAASPRAVAAVPGPTSVAAKRLPGLTGGEIYADPWMRALLLAPDLQRYMTATAFEAPDPTSLKPLMVKPDSVVVMTFCNDPHLGMSSERFAGSAVVFVSTVTFIGRTAMLH